MTIPAYRLPEYIERRSKFSPTLMNVVQESIAGTEQRFAQWTKCRGVGDVSYGLLNSTDPVGDFRAIVAIYRAHYGSLLPFRFRDWSDYTATDDLMFYGDGSTTSFQLRKIYDPSLILLNISGSLQYIRDITLPDISTVTVKVDGVLQATPANYSISSSGLVTFVTAPAAGKAITWSGEFDVPVRFDGELSITTNEADLIAIASLPIKEVIGEA